MKNKIFFDEDILDKVVPNYHIGSGIEYHKQGGWLNVPYRVVTENGDFLFKLYRPGTRTMEQIQFVVDILDSLEKQKLPVHRVVTTGSGFKVVEINVFRHAFYLVVSNFLPGRSINLGEIKLSHIELIGTMVSRLHRALSVLSPQGDSDDTLITEAEEFSARLERIDRQIGENLKKNYFSINKEKLKYFKDNWLKDREDIYRLGQRYNNSEKQLIHADLTVDNFVFLDAKISGILDFDSLKMGTAAEDLSIATGAWILNAVELNILPSIKAILSGYDYSTWGDEDFGEYLLWVKYYIWQQIAWALGPSVVKHLDETNLASLKTFERKYKEFCLDLKTVSFEKLFTPNTKNPTSSID